MKIQRLFEYGFVSIKMTRIQDFFTPTIKCFEKC